MDTANRPTIRFLFRFRDLVAATLDEHEQIIRQRGSCWWGWWKRPSEDHRFEIWAELATATKTTSAGVPVGLFDSGTGAVHLAWITQIILPRTDDQRPEVAESEKSLVPLYYRESPFSRAWMRIVDIVRNIAFFNEYSFADAPRIPNFSPTTLQRFKGKIILDADELRGMDTTIWTVRPKVSGDSSERILLSTPSLSDAISFEVVRCDSDLILHLTDLHFSIGPNRGKHVWRLESEREPQSPSLVGAITSAIGDRKIGLVLVTGDLTFTGEKEEFDEALAAHGPQLQAWI